MRPIGFFDSGVGGLGIFKRVAEKLPHHDLVYVADNANLPFGEKTVEQLNKISATIIQYLIDQHDVQAVVIACNTATVASLDYVRQRFAVPIIGAVPVVKPACEMSKNKRVAIMATPTTAKSAYLQTLIAQYGSDCNVLTIGCPGLANLVETGDLNSPAIHAALEQFLAPIRAHNIDTLGLGCTQYPFLRDKIAAMLPSGVTILDSNEPVARQVERVISSTPGSMPDPNHAPNYLVYATKDAPTFGTVARKLLGSMTIDVQALQLG